MKLTVLGEKIIIYLNTTYTHTLNFDDKENIHNFLKQFFKKLNKKYNLELDGYYNITLYTDKYYGVIIEVTKEELEYFDYFTNQIEMNIKVVQDTFLYQINNIRTNFKEKMNMYKVYDKIYLKAKVPLTSIEMGALLETSKIIYGPKAKNISKTMKEVIIWKNQ